MTRLERVRRYAQGAPVISTRWITGPIESEWDDPPHVPPETTGHIVRIQPLATQLPYTVRFSNGVELDVYEKDIRIDQEP